MPKNKTRDPLPKSFYTIDEFVDFWDSHSTADYPEAFREVKGKVKLRQRRYFGVPLKTKIATRLAKRARAQGVTLEILVNRMLEENLRRAA